MIDEKKLVEEIHKYFKEKIYDNPSGCIVRGILTLNKEICGIIESQPKLNMIPVTKCKDCKYSRIDDDFNFNCGKIWMIRTLGADDFCSCGERKENGKIDI